MIFAVMGQLLMNIFIPAFARCQNAARLRWQYFGIVGSVAGFCAVVIAAAAFFPNEFLFVLGSKYSHLQRELLLMVAGTVMSVLTGALWSLNASKAWIAGAWVAGETDARAGVGADVAEHHRDHVDCGAEVGRDAFLPTIKTSPIAVP